MTLMFCFTIKNRKLIFGFLQVFFFGCNSYANYLLKTSFRADTRIIKSFYHHFCLKSPPRLHWILFYLTPFPLSTGKTWINLASFLPGRWQPQYVINCCPLAEEDFCSPSEDVVGKFGIIGDRGSWFYRSRSRTNSSGPF